MRPRPTARAEGYGGAGKAPNAFAGRGPAPLCR
jgi:hypothetical protein